MNEDRVKTINYISECSKLVQKEYKLDWVMKGNPLGIVQEIKFDYNNKWNCIKFSRIFRYKQIT